MRFLLISVFCSAAMLDGAPDFFRDWDIIDVPYEISKVYLGCNNLIMNDHYVVMPAEEPHDALAAELSKLSLPHDPACPLCGDTPSIIDLSAHNT